MSQLDDEVVQVHEIEATQDRLAGVVEALAYKKAHLKEEAIGAAQVQADRLLEKAEEKKDEVVAKLVDKLPTPDEVRRTARKVVGEVGDKVGDKLPTPHEVRQAGSRAAGEVVEKVADEVAVLKEAAASKVLADEGGH